MKNINVRTDYHDFTIFNRISCHDETVEWECRATYTVDYGAIQVTKVERWLGDEWIDITNLMTDRQLEKLDTDISINEACRDDCSAMEAI